MKTPKWALLLLATLFVAGTAAISKAPANQHQHTAAGPHIAPRIAMVRTTALPRTSTTTPVIDGAAHPEMIPDSDAYRLYLITVANMPADRQRAQLNQAGISGNDLSAAIKTLAAFKAQWDALRDDHNHTVENLGPAAETTAFRASRDALVASTRTALAASLTSTSMQHLSAHIQTEKRRMRISATPNAAGGAK